MVRTRVHVDVNPQVRRIVSQFEWKKHEVTKLTNQVDYRFRKHESAVFKTEGAAGGSKFAPLSTDYKKWKKRHFPGRKILSLTGGLRKSLTAKGPQHVSFGFLTPQPGLVVGTKNRLAAYHGPGRFHNPRLPLRDALQHREKDTLTYEIIVAEFMAKRLERVNKVLATWKAKRKR